MPRFDVVLLAADEYPDPPGPLPASTSARDFGDLLRAGGGRVSPPVVLSSREELVDAIEAWAGDDALTASVVYLVGHGESDGLDHRFLVPSGTVDTLTLAPALHRDWLRRQRDPASWTLLVLDCCDSEVGVANLVTELAAKYPKKPKRLGLWPVAPGGAARTGAFVAAFRNALGTFTENDTVIRLDEVFRRMRRELGDLGSEGFLPDEACLTPPTPAAQVVLPLDVHAELHRAIDGQPPEMRNHFLAKAQGGEVGEVVWHFTGRDAEVAYLCDWLAGDGTMKVVTGEAGSGKSALVGHLAVLADPDLVRLYAESGIAPHLADGPRPPDHVFRAVVHLTGKTAAEAIEEIAAQLWDGGLAGATGAGDDRTERFAAAADAHGVRGHAVLVDALDESQDPLPIAAFLREMAARGVLRVVVGTRRSTGEGPDQPADRARRELLDALGADDADVVEVVRDARAVRDYVVRRLSREGSAYGDNDALVADVADRIAEFDQPFLFARLATAEMYARAIDVGAATMTLLRETGHRGLFAFALRRIAGADPAVYDMLRALAYARGRGLPRTGGIWVDAARAVSGRDLATEDTIASVAELAGPYVTLDGEAGQSTYRLAHQTFAEHFHAQDDYGSGHRRIATALAARYREEGWAGANYYAVRYLPEHLVADADRTRPDTEGLFALVTDPGWLVRAVDTLGVARTVDVIASARRIAGTAPDVRTVERALRRSRTVLSRDPAQLGPQLHARLKDETEPLLAGLGADCAALASRPWLRAVAGRLDWESDLETTYGLVGTVRGLGFGDVDGRPVVAIAIDNRVVLWDPRQGTADEASVIDLGGKRPTAVTIADIDGRAVVVTSAAYEESTDLWDARTGEHLASVPVSIGHCVTVGPVGDRLVVAGVNYGRPVLLDAGSLAPVEPVPALAERNVRGFALRAGALVALCVEGDTADELSVAAVDAAGGGEVWRSLTVRAPLSVVEVIAGYDSGPGFFVVAGTGAEVRWLTATGEHVEDSAHGRTRAVAIGSIDGRPVVVSAPDLAGSALVELREVEILKLASGAMVLWRWGGPRVPLSAPPQPALPAKLAASSGRLTRQFSPERPEEWPHTAWAFGELDGRPVLVTGSVDGAVWVWDTGGDDVRPIAGPLGTVSPRTLAYGSYALASKPAAPTATSVALGRTGDLGPVVAVACDGAVRLYTVPGGQPVPAPSDAATVVDAVALGRVGGRDVLVTGSKGGVLAVWGLTPPERIAALTLDDPIVQVEVRPDGTVVANDAFAVQLVEP